jgi:hypothetical protein
MEDLKDDIKEIRKDVKEIRSMLPLIQIDVAQNAKGLELHMERTALNERRIETIEKWSLGLMASLLAAVILRAFFN